MGKFCTSVFSGYGGEAMRKKKLILNSVTSLLTQLMTIICGLIIPRLIISAYGSQVNGLVSSITQFLSVISLLDLGVGAVVQTALYRPLAERMIYRSVKL